MSTVTLTICSNININVCSNVWERDYIARGTPYNGTSTPFRTCLCLQHSAVVAEDGTFYLHPYHYIYVSPYIAKFFDLKSCAV